MSECPHCGKDAPTTDRFCIRCGTALDEPSILLTRPISASGAVTYGSQRILVGGAVVAVLAVVGYALWLGFGSDSGLSPDDAQTTLPASEPASDPVVADPPLGHPVDLTLFVGGDEGVVAVDLRTGAQTELPIAGTPLVISGRWLVAARDTESGPQGAAVDLDRLVVTDLDLRVIPFPSTTEPGAVDGRAWLLTFTDGVGLEWVQLDLETGREINSVAAPIQDGWHLPYRPSLTSSPAGGVFARRSGFYERVHSGTPVAASEDRVLIRTCSGPADCELTWFTPIGWSPLDVAVPTNPVVDVMAVSADGRLLVYTSTDHLLHLFDAERGMEHDLPENTLEVAVSPDGAHAAVAYRGGALLVSTDDGESVRLDLSVRSTPGLLFGPTSDEVEGGES
ncbi:MAG: zinc ribbon domain-containing protein [Actinomycetia bacterium]|nr:zinc ribbon domain-containing protein [Actinomycetes bacterium]